MNKDEKMVIGTFFGFAVITAATVIASNVGFIPKSMCHLSMTGTFLIGASMGTSLLLRKSKEITSGD